LESVAKTIREKHLVPDQPTSLQKRRKSLPQRGHQDARDEKGRSRNMLTGRW